VVYRKPAVSQFSSITGIATSSFLNGKIVAHRGPGHIVWALLFLFIIFEIP